MTTAFASSSPRRRPVIRPIVQQPEEKEFPLKQSTHRILVKIMFCLLVLSLACGKPFTTEAAPRDARSYLELAKQERKKAEDYRNQSLRHRRGPIHSNLDHARLMKLAQQHENAAEMYERTAEQLLDRASKPANSSARDLSPVTSR